MLLGFLASLWSRNSEAERLEMKSSKNRQGKRNRFIAIERFPLELSHIRAINMVCLSMCLFTILTSKPMSVFFYKSLVIIIRLKIFHLNHQL